MPQDVRLSPDGTTFYVADMGTNELRLIDARTFEQRRVIGLPGCRTGSTRAATARACTSPTAEPERCRVLDFATDKIVDTWTIPGGGSPDMGGVSADGRTLWLSGRSDGVVYGFDTRSGCADRQDPGRRKPARHRGVAAARSVLARATPGTCDEARPDVAAGGPAARRMCGVRVVRVRDARSLRVDRCRARLAGRRAPVAPVTVFVPHVATAAVAGWRLPVASARQAVVRVGHTSVVLAGGLVAGDQSTDQALRIVLATGRTVRLRNRWRCRCTTSVAVSSAGIPAVIGGGNATEQDVVQVLTNGAWHVSGHLPTTRSDLSVVQHGRQPWVIGGYDGTQRADRDPGTGT